ncbi:MAG: hypothetical protein KJI71_00030 [Patescibacteria group bacterium]|nr:hypothetical protein [Patescibacteria group bacterium]
MVKKTIFKFIQVQNKLGLSDLNDRLELDFDKRLLIQKVFYFLIKLGFDFKLKYNFYKYGPYSRELADIYFESSEFISMKIHENSEYHFSSNDEFALTKLKSLLEKWGENTQIWEYYSSLLFIHEDMYFRIWNIENVKAKIAREKHELFDRFKFDSVLQELKELGLITKH